MTQAKPNYMSKNVVLYFPYGINLKAFLLTERLNHVEIDPLDVFLKASLNEDQIQKACADYGAELV